MTGGREAFGQDPSSLASIHSFFLPRFTHSLWFDLIYICGSLAIVSCSTLASLTTMPGKLTCLYCFIFCPSPGKRHGKAREAPDEGRQHSFTPTVGRDDYEDEVPDDRYDGNGEHSGTDDDMQAHASTETVIISQQMLNAYQFAAAQLQLLFPPETEVRLLLCIRNITNYFFTLCSSQTKTDRSMLFAMGTILESTEAGM